MFAFHHTHLSLKGVRPMIIYEGKSPPAMELTSGDIRRCGVWLRLDQAQQRVFPMPGNGEHCLDLTSILLLYLQYGPVLFSYIYLFVFWPLVYM